MRVSFCRVSSIELKLLSIEFSWPSIELKLLSIELNWSRIKLNWSSIEFLHRVECKMNEPLRGSFILHMTLKLVASSSL